MAGEMLADIDKDTVDFTDNFDGTLQEPVVLPSRLPNLLLNGSSGIAVGMATNIPPHNLPELANAINYLIDNYDEIDEVTVADLMNFIPGPDFPTGGIIVGREGILHAYSTGRGRLTVRGLARIEEQKNGRYCIYITEIPYQVNKTTLIERIAELVREDKIDQISDLRDESDRRGMSIVIELKRGAQPRQVLNQLYKYTPLQSTFGVQMLALVDNEPRLLPLKRALHIFIEHRQVVITRRSNFELAKARARAHILEGLLIALANLDEVIKTIRESADVDTARAQLVARFNLSELQAQAILDMQLRRLAALERQKIEDEHKEVHSRIDYLEDLLANPKKILALVKEDMQEIAEKYGDERRTHIAGDVREDFSEEDLVADEAVLVTLTARGYIKRVDANVYRVQNRGGRGVTGQGVREEDEVVLMAAARTLDNLLFFSDRGKVYAIKAHQIPEANRTDRGVPVINVLALEATERITAVVGVADFKQARYCTMATLAGRVKRVALSEFSSVRPSGLIAINLDNGDKLGWARVTGGKDHILLVTAGGRALRFREEEVRTMGRQAAGVAGIRVNKGDQLVSMEIIEPEGALLVVTEKGFGKKTNLEEYPVKGRATGGVLTTDQKALDKIGQIAVARVVQPSDEVALISSNGIALRLKVSNVSSSGRGTRGVHLMGIENGDTVAAIARLPVEIEAIPEQ